MLHASIAATLSRVSKECLPSSGSSNVYCIVSVVAVFGNGMVTEKNTMIRLDSCLRAVDRGVRRRVFLANDFHADLFEPWLVAAL